jgi:hypothetical protein
MTKTTLAAVLASLLVAACAETGAPRAPAAPSASAPADVRGSSFDDAMKRAGLVQLDLVPVSRAHAGTGNAGAKVEGRRVTISTTGGWNTMGITLAKGAAGRIYRVVGVPEEKVVEKVVDGCQGTIFAGGHRWFEEVTFDLPEGTTWGGDVTLRYPVTRVVERYTNKSPSGGPCPPPIPAFD